MGEDAEADRPRTNDEAAKETRESEGSRDDGGIEPAEPAEPLPPVDRALSRLGGTLGGRPLSVYGVLLAGAAVLFILLAIIWFTAGGGGDGDGPTCQNVELAAALELIKDGEVERVRITYAQDRASVGPILANLAMVDDSCRILQPQGVQGELAMYMIIGAIEYRNRTSEDRRVDLDIEASDSILPELLWTPTVPPTETVEPTPTVPTPTEPPASPTALPPTETATATATATPTATSSGSPDASPDASPAGSPADFAATGTSTPGP